MAPSVLLLLLLLLLLNSSSSLPPPRTSFLLNSTDRPLIVFGLPDVHNITTLLLSDDRSTLYVGARDAVLSLDVSHSDVISLKQKVEWRPSTKEINDCQSKGKNATVDCPNFISVLQQINSSHLYVCGSFAYNPHDSFIDTETFSMVQHSDARAKTRCPFSPAQRSTAITADGELFTATTTDFRGVKPQISRHFSKDGRPDVSLDSSVSLLEEPTFIGSSLDPPHRKLYFFFTEVGTEFSFVDELRIARVAQVCKDDVGGQRTLQNKWTSFAKASLLCHLPKQLPYNILQDVFSLPPEDGDASDTLIYGVFTSQWSSGPESAVCVFNLQDIRTVFAGSYRTFNMQTHQWSPMLGKHSYLGQCGQDNATDLVLDQIKRSFLTSSSVAGSPLIVSSEHRFSHVAAMRTTAADGGRHTVLFLLTESGFLHKVVLLDRGVQVIEEVQVFRQPEQVRSIVLSSSKGVLYVGTSRGVVGVPVARCSSYRSCSQCVLARDPLCGWNRTSSTCSRVDGRHDDLAQDLKDGDVRGQCGGETRSNQVLTEVSVLVNKVVRLPCLKPSNMAVLSWTSPRFRNLPDRLFMTSADGCLSFVATADTFGTYRCEAEEGGYREVVVSYDVQQVATPRSISPDKKDQSLEEPPSMIPSGDPEDDWMKVEVLKEDLDKDSGFTVMPSRVAQLWTESLGGARVKKQSYYSELVVVSFLLASSLCVLVLGGLYLWRLRKTGAKMSPLVSPVDSDKTNRSMESVPSLSSPEDAGSELKVVD